MYGGVSNNQGAAAEEFYFNSLKHDPVLRGIRFDYVYKNLTGKRRDIQDEYDILLLNGDDVFIIEVKYRAHVRDVETLTGRKTEHFKWLFPLYGRHRLHSGLASFCVDEETLTYALERDVTVLQRRGELIETIPATPFH